MSITLDDLLATGQPHRVSAAIAQHPDLSDDQRFRKLFRSLKAEIDQYVADFNGRAATDSELAQQSRQLMARLGHLVDYQRIHDFAVDPDTLPPPLVRNTGTERTTVLFLASNPGGLLQLDREWKGVSMALQDKKEQFDLNISDQVTKEKVRTELLKYRPQLVHFSGHGVAEGNTFREGGLIFQAPGNINKTDTMAAATAASMFTLLHEQFPIQLVLLNACESAEHAREISRLGCHAIGMTVEIGDGKATDFAKGFYEGLAAVPGDFIYAFKQGVDWLPKPDRIVPKLFYNGEEVVTG